MVDLAPPGHQPPRRTFRARRPVRSVRGGRRSRSPRPPDGGAKPGALFRLTGNRRWPHMAPWNTRPRRSSSSQIPENCANAANSWIPANGRSRTRTWDLFLIRKTFCRLQSPQLALNPCKACNSAGGRGLERTGGYKLVAPSWPHGRDSRAGRRMTRKRTSCRRYGQARTLRRRAAAACMIASRRRASVRGRARPSVTVGVQLGVGGL